MANRVDRKPAERISQVPRKSSVPPMEEKKALAPGLQQTLNENLLRAAKRKQWKRMEALLEEGAKAEEKDDRRFSALTYAASEGQSNLVRMMIKAGVSVSIKDFASRVAFIKAHINGHKETAKLLLEAGELGAGNSIIPLPPLTPEQEGVVAEIEWNLWNGETS